MTDDEVIASCVTTDDVDDCGSENEAGDHPEEVMTHVEATTQWKNLYHS